MSDSSTDSSSSSIDSGVYPDEFYKCCEKKPTRLKPAGYALVLALLLSLVGVLFYELQPHALPEPAKKVENIEFNIKGIPIKLSRETR